MGRANAPPHCRPGEPGTTSAPFPHTPGRRRTPPASDRTPTRAHQSARRANRRPAAHRSYRKKLIAQRVAIMVTAVGALLFAGHRCRHLRRANLAGTPRPGKSRPECTADHRGSSRPTSPALRICCCQAPRRQPHCLAGLFVVTRCRFGFSAQGNCAAFRGSASQSGLRPACRESPALSGMLQTKAGAKAGRW